VQKIVIKNRKGQSVSVLVEDQTQPIKGLVFVMHGLGGFKNQPHIRAISAAFQQNGYRVVSFDTTNSFGESDGNYEDATTMNYYEDLGDVIQWASDQDWYQEPFVLCGHSLGGICTALYAEINPDKVRALAPISTVVSGELSTKTPEHLKISESWQKTGWREKESATVPGLIKRLKWPHIEDRMKYDILPEVNKLTMPVLLIVGDQDGSTPLEHQQILYEKLPGKKKLHVIKGAPHTFREPEHLKELQITISDWVKSLD
jgi:hypothetical protein